MRYSVEVTIDWPIDEVIALFDDPTNLKLWMEGLVSFEPLSGTPGRPGAKSRLVFEENGRRIEMVETVTVRDLPREFSGTYEAKGVYNEVKNFFSASGPSKTRYVSEQYFRFGGGIRLIAFLMPGIFRKQSMKYLESFKRFAESRGKE